MFPETKAGPNAIYLYRTSRISWTPNLHSPIEHRFGQMLHSGSRRWPVGHDNQCPPSSLVNVPASFDLLMSWHECESTPSRSVWPRVHLPSNAVLHRSRGGRQDLEPLIELVLTRGWYGSGGLATNYLVLEVSAVTFDLRQGQVTLQDVQADSSELVDIRMVNLC